MRRLGGITVLGIVLSVTVGAGVEPLAAAGASARQDDCASAWLDGAVSPLVIEPVDATPGASGDATSRVVDERIAEAQRLVREHPLDPPRAARAYVISTLAAREALRVLPSSLRDGAHAAVERAFTTAARTRGVYAPAAAAEVAPALAPTSLDTALAGLVGVVVARRIISAVAADGSDVASLAKVTWDSDPKRATKSGTWVPTAPGFLPPLQPGWGDVRGIGLDPREVRPDIVPPAWNSPRMERSRTTFLALHRDIEPRLVDIGHRWNDGSGTSTPAGTWLERANGHTRNRAPNVRLEVLAATSVVVHDAFVLAWDRKFNHMTARPIQWMKGVAWKAWKPFIPTPPFPSWPSGHATVSGAAAEVIGTMVPAAAERQRAAAREAAQSRLWAGIHWNVDNDDGLVLGRDLARELAAASSTCT